MPGWSNEFKVGILAAFAIAAAAWGLGKTDDRPAGKRQNYEVYAVFNEAEGVYPSTQARVAGVGVGSVQDIELIGGQARVTLELGGDVRLSVDSVATLKSEGVLGDRFVRITPGHADSMLEPGDTLETTISGPDLDALQDKVESIADDVKAITGATRRFVESEDNKTQIERTISNLDALATELRGMTATNRENLEVIATNLRDLTDGLNEIVKSTGPELREQMAALRQATDRLDHTLADVESITDKIDNGEGTLGVLVNDRSTIDEIDATVDNLNSAITDIGGVVDSITGLQTEVFYKGAYMLGNDPSEPGFTSNPVSGLAKNTLGVRIMPESFYWYQIEVVAHPLDQIRYEETLDAATGATSRAYVREPGYRLSFQFARRWGHLVGRIGLKESSGGAGADLLMLDDRLTLSADMFDFTFGSWPVMDGTPNLTLTAQLSPTKHVYVLGGLDNAIFGARHGFFTGFVGAGFWFTDEDLKWVLAGLPFPN